ncbi:hypothetical protein [Phaeodactylibacter xiamenensis]|uniref:hypothetical protein n=1 Tax=Phaeodactylibacter xiamenensis TaxID=1524460 RepID=UPI003CCC460A
MDLKTKSLFFVFILLMVSVCAHAQENIKISVQGILKDPNGLAVDDGTQTITFRLYNEAEGGDMKHEETAPVQVRGGVYSYLLGTVAPLDSSDFNETLYLELTVGDAAEPLKPRTQMTYAPYALSVNIAQRAISADSTDVAVTAETAQTASRLLSGPNSCSGAVGDIKYSILTPDQFVLENGDCWVPMDGRSITGTKLEDDYGWDDVPDMSGLFIRAQEFENGANNDPNRTSSSAVGEYQEDRFRNHTHQSARNNIEFNAKSGPDQSRAWANTAGTSGFSPTSGATNNPGDETRPRNRNFYVYIRVN